MKKTMFTIGIVTLSFLNSPIYASGSGEMYRSDRQASPQKESKAEAGSLNAEEDCQLEGELADHPCEECAECEASLES